MSEEVATSVAGLLDSLATLFQIRAGKAEENAKSSVRGNTQYWQGFAAAYEDASRECRNAATKMRTP